MNPDDPRSPDPVEDDPLMDEDEEGEGIGPQHENPDAGMGTARK